MVQISDSECGSEAFSRAVQAHSPAKELFSVVKDLDAVFGYSDGQILYRAVGSELFGADALPAKHLQRVGGTRKAGALGQVAARLTANYKQVCLALQARMEWRRSKHGSITLESLAETSRRLRDVSFVAFMVAFQSVMIPVGEHIKIVQSTAEPWSISSANAKCITKLAELSSAIERTECFISVCVLLGQHCSVAERGRCLALYLKSVNKSWNSHIAHDMCRNC